MALPLRDDAPTRRVPWVTYALIAANVVVFLLLQPPVLQGGGGVDESGLSRQQQSEVDSYFFRWGAIPCEIQHLQPLSSGISCPGEHEDRAPRVTGKIVLLSVLTAMFIHGSILHLAGNMLFLWVFGRNVEDRIGPALFLSLYLVTGVIATMGHAAFHWDDAVPVLGASGAIAGIMGAYLVFRPRGRILSIVFWMVVYVPAWVLLGLFFVTQFLTPDSEGVAWMAHAAGMAAGFLIALGLAQVFKDPYAPVEVAAPVAPAAAWTLPPAPPVR